MKKSERLSNDMLVLFCDQTAILMGGGLPLADGMDTLSEEHGDTPLGRALADLKERMYEKGTMAEAMEGDPRWPEFLRKMVGVGERTGRLQDVLVNMQAHYKREEEIRQAISGAVIYPLTLSAMLSAIVVVMLVWVLPLFRRVLDGLGIGASGQTMLRWGTAIAWAVLVLVGLAMLVTITALVMVRTSAKDKVLNILMEFLRPLAKYRRDVDSFRVASVLSLGVSGGFSLEEALEMAGDVLSSEDDRQRVVKVASDLHDGDTLADSMQKNGFFSDMHCHMLRLGARYGEEDKVLNQLEEIYADQAQAGLEKMISVIEPILVAVIAVVIGGVLLSVMLPMAGVLTGML